MECVGYVRVSSIKQVENYSLDEQEKMIKNYAKDNNFKLLKIYREEGKSGKNKDREELQNMLSDLKKGVIKHVIIISTDRFSRSVNDTTTIVENFFIPNGIELHAVLENIDITTDTGLTMLQMSAVFAEYERKAFRRRSEMGKMARANEGKWNGGNFLPLGYDYIDGELIVNEKEAEIVKEIFSYFLTGATLRGTCKHMREYTSSDSTTFCSSNVKNILKSKIYIGYIRYKGKWYKGTHESIIDINVYNAVQELIKKREESYSGPHTKMQYSKHLFTGLIYCARCGSKYAYTDKRYVCYSQSKKYYKYIIDPNCKNKRIKEDDLKNEIFRYLLELDLEKIEYKKENKQGKISIVKDNIKKIEEKENKLLDLYLNDSISKDVLDSKVLSFRREKELLAKRLEELESTITKEEEFTNSLDLFKTTLIEGDDKKIKGLIELLIKRIEVDGENITIYLNI